MRRLPPGPPPHPLFGHLRSHLNNQRILPALLELHRDYGPAVRLYFGPPSVGIPVISFADPALIGAVLQDSAKTFKKSRSYTRLRTILGDGLLTSEGDFWRRQRRLAQPAFHKQRLADFAATMAACTHDMLERWAPLGRRGDVLDVAHAMSDLTFRIVGKTLFSADLAGEARTTGTALEAVLRYAADMLDQLVPLPTWVPTQKNLEFGRALRVLDEVVYGIIAERRRMQGERPHDLLTMLLEARDDETNEQMTDRQLRDEVMTFVLAGHETTSNALAWTFYLLSRYPHALGRVVAEADAVLGDRVPTFEDAQRLVYTRQVIEESMRLYPPAWILERESLIDQDIGDFHVPAGTTVVVAPYAVHRSAALWDNPEGFDPDRFAPAAVAERPRHAYFPFGMGARMCIGAGFAMIEAQLVLAMVARRFRLDLVPGYPVIEAPHITLRMQHGMKMRVIERPRPTVEVVAAPIDVAPASPNAPTPEARS